MIPGLQLVAVECAGSRGMLGILANPGAAVPAISACFRAIGRLGYAMGGSQHVNRIVEPLHLELGIETPR